MFAKTVILLATAAVTLGSPTCTCGKEKKQVCGTDAHTYDNECLLMCAGLTNSYIKLEHKGPCTPQHPLPTLEPECICPYLYKPVCGTDGKTYSNACALNCLKRSRGDLEIKAQGACETSEQVQVVDGNPLLICKCERNYKPVCGTDGKTYSNECDLNCMKRARGNLEIQSQGACQSKEQVNVVDGNQLLPICQCVRNYRPVCGNDGKTYNNECLLRCNQETNRNLQIAREGRCETVQVVENEDTNVRMNNEGPRDDQVKVVN